MMADAVHGLAAERRVVGVFVRVIWRLSLK
jgi:hypothetical protein